MLAAKIYDMYAQKLSDVTKIPFPYIVALRDNGLLDQDKAIEKLVRNDYRALKKASKLSDKQILAKLCDYYGLKELKVKKILKTPTKNYYYCKFCGSVVTKTVYFANDGLCDKCVAKKLKL